MRLLVGDGAQLSGIGRVVGVEDARVPVDVGAGRCHGGKRGHARPFDGRRQLPPPALDPGQNGAGVAASAQLMGRKQQQHRKRAPVDREPDDRGEIVTEPVHVREWRISGVLPNSTSRFS